MVQHLMTETGIELIGKINYFITTVFKLNRSKPIHDNQYKPQKAIIE